MKEYTPILPMIDPTEISIRDALQLSWTAFRRNENETESEPERARLESLRNRLSALMRELEAVK